MSAATLSLTLLATIIGGPPTPPPLVPALTKDQAWDLVLSLPEVIALGKDIPERSKGEAKLIVMDDGDAAPGLWTFYVGENHPTHVHRRETFEVSAYTGEILVWDSERDGYLPLSERRELRPR
jgi:hypothetical protein